MFRFACSQCNALVKVPRRAWWRAGMLCLAVGAALLALGFVVVAYLFASPPATCKELVEYFQSRGMKLSWQVMNTNPPTMHVNCENCATREVMNPSPWGGASGGNSRRSQSFSYPRNGRRTSGPATAPMRSPGAASTSSGMRRRCGRSGNAVVGCSRSEPLAA